MNLSEIDIVFIVSFSGTAIIMFFIIFILPIIEERRKLNQEGKNEV